MDNLIQNEIDWNNIFKIWNTYNPSLGEELSDVEFKVNCNRTGNHTFRSVDIASYFAKQYSSRFPNWKMNQKDYEVTKIHYFKLILILISYYFYRLNL